jgi:acyl-CoA thioesterase II
MAAISTTQVPTHYPKSKSYHVRSLDENKFVGVQPLSKPSENSRGVFGGNLCAQAILAAQKTVDSGFVPNSLHSYFVKPGCDKTVCEYEIERLSQGKVFANRLVRVYQKGDLKYVVMISFSSRNSIDKTKRDYTAGKSNTMPFEYQLPVNSTFYKYNLHDIPTRTDFDHGQMLHHKFPPNFVDKELNMDEHEKSAAERDLSFWVKLDDKKSSQFKYPGFGIISDSIFLTSVSRILQMPLQNGFPIGATGGKNDYFLSVSLDHSIYFHDDNFDPTNWIFVNFKTPRFCNNRVFIQAGYYDQNGKLFASIVQEGLVLFHNKSELKAKL